MNPGIGRRSVAFGLFGLLVTGSVLGAPLQPVRDSVAVGRPVDEVLPPGADEAWVVAAKKAAFGRAADGSVGRELDLRPGLDPMLGGFCKTCPVGVSSPDFIVASFPPAGTFAFHPSALTGAGDCNWYEFPTLPGHRYEFRTCSPGSTDFDSLLEVFASSCADLLACSDEDSDDAPGCGTASAVEFVCPTGTTAIYLRVSAFSAGSGAYSLAYREAACPTCANPSRELTPTTTCQYVDDGFVQGTGQCLESWFKVNLVSGESYSFTTCPTGAGAICPLANATPSTFDTDMFLYAPLDCSLGPPLAHSTGSVTCSTAPTGRARITYTATSTGQYLLRIKGPALGGGRFGCYWLGHAQLP